MSPITVNGSKYFPQQEKLLDMLKAGDMFKQKRGNDLYTINQNGEPENMKGEVVFMPAKMPVIPLKKF